MNTNSMRRPVLVMAVVALLATASVFGLVAYMGVGTVGAAPGLDEPVPGTTPEPSPQTTPVPTLEITPVDEPVVVTPPLNSTLDDPEETVTLSTSWGSVGAHASALEIVDSRLSEDSTQPRNVSNPWAGTARCQNVPGLPKPTSHEGRVVLTWDLAELFENTSETRTASSYLIERRYYFPTDYGASEYQVVEDARRHSGGSAAVQTYTDHDVASRSIYEYRITPKLSDGTKLVPGEFMVKSSTSRRLEGYGVANGIKLHMRFEVRGNAAGQAGKLTRLRRACNGTLTYGSFMGIMEEPLETEMSHEDTWPTDVRQAAYYAVVVSATSTTYSYSTMVHVESTDALPSAPRNLSVSGSVGGAVSLSWDKPDTNAFQVASYEILRQKLHPRGDNHWAVVGTSKDRSFTDTMTYDGFHYDYRVRAVTKQDTRGPESAIVGIPTLADLTCSTGYGSVAKVSHVFLDYDVFDPSGGVGSPMTLDIWAYATTDAGNLERCTILDDGRLRLERETYYKHVNFGTCVGGTSCDVLDVNPGDGEFKTIELGWRGIKAGWPRHLFNRVYMRDLMRSAGVFEMRHQACVVNSGGARVCSQWRDTGTVNWRVPGLSFASDQVVPAVYPTPPLWSEY